MIKNRQLLFENMGVYVTAVFFLLTAIIFSLCFSASVGQADVPLRQTFDILVNKISGGSLGSLENIPNSFVSEPCFNCQSLCHQNGGSDFTKVECQRSKNGGLKIHNI